MIYKHEFKYLKHYPFRDKISNILDDRWVNIRKNLALSVLHRDYPPLKFWLAKTYVYLSKASIRFSKEDHVELIHLLVELIQIEHLDQICLGMAISSLNLLLKKIRVLTREDLTLDWRPFYQLLKFMISSAVTNRLVRLFNNALSDAEKLCKLARYYFPADETANIYVELKQYLVPMSKSFERGLFFVDCLLPIHLPVEELKTNFEIWLPELLEMWMSIISDKESIESKFFSIFANCYLPWFDWNPYIPKIFDKIFRSFGLPSKLPSNLDVPLAKFSNANFDDDAYVSKIIISVLGGNSSAMTHLKTLMSALETYFHPSNLGSWTNHLINFICNLSDEFVERISIERQWSKKSWHLRAYLQNQLTDDDIEEFVNIMKPASFMALFKKGFEQERPFVNILNLCSLREDIILKSLIDRTYVSLNSLVEPHQLIACIRALTLCSQYLVTPSQRFPEVQTHVLPLLNQVLPGIDPSDFKKSSVTVCFIHSVVEKIPFIDCSAAVRNGVEMSEIERELCNQSANFEEWMLLCFQYLTAFVDNFKSTTGFLQNLEFAPFFGDVLSNASPEIFKNVVDKVFNYLTDGNIPEADFPSNLLHFLSRSRHQGIVDRFLPYLEDKINSLATLQNLEVEVGFDAELLWCIHILNRVVTCCDAHRYAHRFFALYSKLINAKLKNVYQIVGRGVYSLFYALITILPENPTNFQQDFTRPFEEVLPVRHWGNLYKKKDIHIDWIMPDEIRMEAIEHGLDVILEPQLKFIEDCLSSEKFDIDILNRSLHYVFRILHAVKQLLPQVKGDHKFFVQFEVDLTPYGYNVLTEDLFPSASNLRSKISVLIHDLLHKLLSSETHRSNVTALRAITAIIQDLIPSDDSASINFALAYANTFPANPLRKDLYMRCDFLRKTQVKFLTGSIGINDHTIVTDEVILLFKDIWMLSFFELLSVRSAAQKIFSRLISKVYNFMHIIKEDVFSAFEDPPDKEEVIKGLLYCSKIIFERSYDLEVRSRLTTSLLSLQGTNFADCGNYFNKMITAILNKTVTQGLQFKPSEELMKIVVNTLKDFDSAPNNVRIDEIIASYTEREDRLIKQFYDYQNLLIEYLSAYESPLHTSFISVLLALLVRMDFPPPSKHFTAVLRHIVKKGGTCTQTTIYLLVSSLWAAKLPLNKLSIDQKDFSHRLPTQNLKDLAPSPDQHDEHLFFDGAVQCFYPHKRHLEVTPPYVKLPAILYSPELKDAIITLFDEEGFLLKVFDTFEPHGENPNPENMGVFSKFWKHIFRIAPNKYLDVLFHKMLADVNSTENGSHFRTAALTSGILKASVFYSRRQLDVLQEKLTPFLKELLSCGNLNHYIWNISLRMPLVNRDPARFLWLIQLIIDTGVNCNTSTKLKTVLSILTDLLSAFSYDGSALRKQAYDLFLDKVDNDFRVVRYYLARLYIGLFSHDVNLSFVRNMSNPRMNEFIAYLIKQIEPMEEICKTEDFDKSAVQHYCRAANTASFVIHSMREAIDYKTGINPSPQFLTHASGFYRLAPLIATLEILDNDANVGKEALVNVQTLAHIPLVEHHFEEIISVLDKFFTFPVWRLRRFGLVFLQQLIMRNMFVVCSNKTLVETFKKYILLLLKDLQFEIRMFSSLILSDLIHCGIIKVDQDLIKLFHKAAKAKVKSENGDIDIKKRHSGILGIIACINAYPYDVPSWMPSLVMTLIQHIQDPSPIDKAVKSALTDFKRTHHDNWQEHQTHFSTDEIQALSEILISPNYYI